ncbi:MAG: oligopeptide ABC transporter ATP-binding protein, partial [Mesorhizobium sp.]
VEGEVQSPITPPSGCAFHPRCPLAVERCRIEVPPLVPLADGRVVACHVRAPATELPGQPAAAGDCSLAREASASIDRS